jgi:hypothetical protein
LSASSALLLCALTSPACIAALSHMYGSCPACAIASLSRVHRQQLTWLFDTCLPAAARRAALELAMALQQGIDSGCIAMPPSEEAQQQPAGEGGDGALPAAAGASGEAAAGAEGEAGPSSGGATTSAAAGRQSSGRCVRGLAAGMVRPPQRVASDPPLPLGQGEGGGGATLRVLCGYSSSVASKQRAAAVGWACRRRRSASARKAESDEEMEAEIRRGLAKGDPMAQCEWARARAGGGGGGGQAMGAPAHMLLVLLRA